jgi:uncharacterized membrane protein required for colicin V production
MVWIDYAILAIIGISTLVSLVRGFTKEAVSLVIWIGAFFIDAFTGAANTTWWQSSQLIPEFTLVVEWFFEYLKGSSSFLS